MWKLVSNSFIISCWNLINKMQIPTIHSAPNKIKPSDDMMLTSSHNNLYTHN